LTDLDKSATAALPFTYYFYVFHTLYRRYYIIKDLSVQETFNHFLKKISWHFELFEV